MKLKLVTEGQATEKRCPHLDNIQGHCVGSQCMAWVEVWPRVERENHSGGEAIVYKIAANTGQHPELTGPHSCSGVWVLEAKGYCGCNALINEVK